MKNAKRMSLIWTIILIVLSVILTIGVRTVFSACTGTQDDGSYMSCHWAQQAIFGTGIVLIVLSVLQLFVKDGKAKAAFSCAMLPVAVYEMLIPGVLIHLCVMADMHCRAAMRPAALIFGVLVIVFAVINILTSRGIRAEEND